MSKFSEPLLHLACLRDGGGQKFQDNDRFCLLGAENDFQRKNNREQFHLEILNQIEKKGTFTYVK